MTEFAFDGGYRGPGPSWEEHKFDRDTGRPRVGHVSDMPSESESWADRQLLAKIRVTRTRSFFLEEGKSENGDCGVIHSNGLEGIKRQIYDQWGGGSYKLQYPGPTGGMRVVPAPGCVREVHVPGYSKTILRTVEPVEPSQSLPPELQELTPEDEDSSGEQAEEVSVAKEVTVGCLVWLELSKQGPFKVVAKYDHVLGASVAAHYPNTAKNEYERVRVPADLFWLCQDSVGQVHILAAGSLTTVPPSSALKGAGQRLASAGAWAWSKREVVLWASLAVAGSKALGVF